VYCWQLAERAYFGNHVLEFLHFGGNHRTAVGSLELIPVVRGRIVTGCNDNTQSGFQFGYTQTDHGRTYKTFRSHVALNTVSSEHTCRGEGKKLTCKAAVMTNHRLFHFVLFHEKSGGFSHTFHIVNGEVIGDACTPSIGTKLDRNCHTF